MRSRYHIAVMAGVMAALALPAAAQMVGARPNDVRGQLGQTPPARNAAAAPARPAAPAPARPATQNPAAPAPRNVAAPASAPAVAPVQTTAAPATAPAAASRRDPFDPLLGRTTGQGAAVPASLPPGKAGLTIGTLRIDGLVRGPNGMIAVVSSPQQRVYFLRENDRIYDGQVTRITMEAVSFQQTGRDPFGNPLEREVTRRLYPSPGEQR